MAMVAMCGCKEKEPDITSILDIDSEIKAYFVDYVVGTKWIYQDTMSTDNYDTIELVRIEPYDKNRKGVLEKGYMLHYKAQKSRDFKVSVSRGQGVNFYIRMYTDVTGSGAVYFENHDGEWADWLNYYDSLEITGNMYFEVIESESTNMFHYMVKISKNKGIIFFYRMQGGAMWAAYKLIKTEKP